MMVTKQISGFSQPFWKVNSHKFTQILLWKTEVLAPKLDLEEEPFFLRSSGATVDGSEIPFPTTWNV